MYTTQWIIIQWLYFLPPKGWTELPAYIRQQWGDPRTANDDIQTFQQKCQSPQLRSEAYQTGGVGVTPSLLHALSQGRQERVCKIPVARTG